MQVHRQLSPHGDLVIHFSGEMDAVGCVHLRPALEEVATDTGQHRIILDLSDVTFLDSSGIGAIVFLYKRVRAREGELSIANVRGQPRELIELLRIDSAIPVNWDGAAPSWKRQAG